MKTELTLMQIYFNVPILKFFFRLQSMVTLETMVKRAGSTPKKFDELENAIEGYYDSIDDFEEDCYYLTAKEILDNLEIEYK